MLTAAIACRAVICATRSTAAATTTLSAIVAGLRRGAARASAWRAAIAGTARRTGWRRWAMRSAITRTGMRAVVRARTPVPIRLAAIARPVAAALVVIGGACGAANADRNLGLNHCRSAAISVVLATIGRRAIRIDGTAAEQRQGGESGRKSFDSMGHDSGLRF